MPAQGPAPLALSPRVFLCLFFSSSLSTFIRLCRSAPLFPCLRIPDVERERRRKSDRGRRGKSRGEDEEVEGRPSLYLSPELSLPLEPGEIIHRKEGKEGDIRRFSLPPLPIRSAPAASKMRWRRRRITSCQSQPSAIGMPSCFPHPISIPTTSRTEYQERYSSPCASFDAQAVCLVYFRSLSEKVEELEGEEVTTTTVFP